MEITKFDITTLVVMSLVVVAMSFVMPALGLTTTETSQSDIPELNINNNTFDFTGDQPAFPNTPTEGTLTFDTTRDLAFSENQVFLDGDTSAGVELSMIQNVSDPTTADVFLTRYNSSGVAEQEELYIGPNASSEGVFSVTGYTVAVEQSDGANPPDLLEVNWKIAEGSENDGFLASIFGGVAAIVDVLAWAVIIFIWFSQALVQGSLNALVIIVDASIYFISLLNWLATTYFSVVTAAPGWAKIFVSIPGIILSVMLGKVVAVFISLLPAT